MGAHVENLERKLARMFSSIPSEQYELISRDFKYIVENGLRSADDLPRMALDPSLCSPVRASACWFLARLSPRSISAPILMSLLANSPSTVRAEAARSFGVIRSKKAIKTLIDLALHERDSVVRESCVYALGSFDDNRSVDALLTIARSCEESHRLRALAIEQLGMTGVARRDMLETLASLTKHEGVEISFWAVYALGRVGDERAIATLQRVVDDDSRQLPPFGTLREEALSAIETIRSREALAREDSSNED